jgi:hypothetical protein
MAPSGKGLTVNAADVHSVVRSDSLLGREGMELAVARIERIDIVFLDALHMQGAGFQLAGLEEPRVGPFPPGDAQAPLPTPHRVRELQDLLDKLPPCRLAEQAARLRFVAAEEHRLPDRARQLRRRFLEQ